MADDKGLPGGVGLAEAISALREELTQAMENAPRQGIRFKPGPVELTVQAALTKSAGAKAGVKWWLIEAGGEGSRQSVVTQTLKITLETILINSEGKVIDALVSGAEGSAPSNPAKDKTLKGSAEK